jgi:hypothetical protein
MVLSDLLVQQAARPKRSPNRVCAIAIWVGMLAPIRQALLPEEFDELQQGGRFESSELHARDIRSPIETTGNAQRNT